MNFRYIVQSANRNPGTCSKSTVFRVRIVYPRDNAIDAMRRSNVPIRTPNARNS